MPKAGKLFRPVRITLTNYEVLSSRSSLLRFSFAYRSRVGYTKKILSLYFVKINERRRGNGASIYFNYEQISLHIVYLVVVFAAL